MHQRSRTKWQQRLLAPVIVTTAMLMTLPACAQAEEDSVAAWVQREAKRLNTTDAAAPLNDFMPLRDSARDVTIAGLGESVHGAAEELTLKHRALRFLVEEMGFRSIAWEEDWTAGVPVNDYISGGPGDLDALVRGMSGQWQTREVKDVLRWLRQFNAGQAHKVQFVGVEYFFTWTPVYDAVRDYVARNAPGQLTELNADLEKIRPVKSDIYQHIEWLTNEVRDKPRYVNHARQVHELLGKLPHRAGDRAYELALHNARQILSFYEHFNMSPDDALVYRDARAADNVKWWQGLTGDKIVYWAASPHIVNAAQLRIATAQGDMRFPSAGSYLRKWYGRQYLSVGFTFDHGTASLGEGKTAAMSPPKPEWFEQPFSAVRADQFILDLRAKASSTVQKWLNTPSKTRGLPHAGPDSYVDGGSPGQWFDVVIHRQQINAAQPAT